MGAPLPFKTKLAAEMVLKLQALCDSLNIVKLTGSATGVEKLKKLERAVEFVVADGGGTCKRLMELVGIMDSINVDGLETVGEFLAWPYMCSHYEFLLPCIVTNTWHSIRP